MELNSNEIAKINPHRYPFALVDRITDYKPGEYAKGIKCVSVNEMQFMGHFPEHHVMPGVRLSSLQESINVSLKVRSFLEM